MTDKKRRCVYCGSEEKKLTREHIVSKSVLKAIFGPDIENTARLPIGRGGQFLFDYEPQVRDVCGECNHALSPYDVAGVELAHAIRPYHDATGRTIPLTQDTLGWLLKTHLNEMRATPDENFAQPRAKSSIYRALLKHNQVSLNWYRLYVEGWEGDSGWWTKDSPRSIEYLSYKGLQDAATTIYISNFRLAWLDTFLLLPMDGNYREFKARCDETQRHAAQYEFSWQRVDAANLPQNGRLAITNIVPRASVERVMTKVAPIQVTNRWT